MKQLSYSSQIKRHYFYCGLLWIAAGTTGLFTNIPYCDLASALLLLVNATLFFSTISKKKECADEMAKTHLDKAMAIAFEIGLCIIMISSLIFDLNKVFSLNLNFNFNNCFSQIMEIVFGLLTMLVGYLFKFFEER